MKIAIVDDLVSDRNILCECLNKYAQANNIDMDISEFTSGENFLTEFQSGVYDIIFLDIYMAELTGVDTAKNIFAADKKCKIKFLSTSNSFAAESYEVNAVQYILKPLNPEKLNNVLDRCTADMVHESKVLNVISNKVPVKIYFKDILYVDITINTVNIHLKDKVIHTGGRFYNTVAPLLEDKNFMECYKGIVVNMEHIHKNIDSDFVLDNDERIPIRKRQKSEILRKYMEYEFENM